MHFTIIAKCSVLAAVASLALAATPDLPASNGVAEKATTSDSGNRVLDYATAKAKDAAQYVNNHRYQAAGAAAMSGLIHKRDAIASYVSRQRKQRSRPSHAHKTKEADGSMKSPVSSQTEEEEDDEVEIDFGTSAFSEREPNMPGLNASPSVLFKKRTAAFPDTPTPARSSRTRQEQLAQTIEEEDDEIDNNAGTVEIFDQEPAHDASTQAFSENASPSTAVTSSVDQLVYPIVGRPTEPRTPQEWAQLAQADERLATCIAEIQSKYDSICQEWTFNKRAPWLRIFLSTGFRELESGVCATASGSNYAEQARSFFELEVSTMNVINAERDRLQDLLIGDRHATTFLVWDPNQLIRFEEHVKQAIKGTQFDPSGFAEHRHVRAVTLSNALADSEHRSRTLEELHRRLVDAGLGNLEQYVGTSEFEGAYDEAHKTVRAMNVELDNDITRSMDAQDNGLPIIPAEEMHHDEALQLAQMSHARVLKGITDNIPLQYVSIPPLSSGTWTPSPSNIDPLGRSEDASTFE